MAIEIKTVSLPDTELEVKRLIPHPEDILTPRKLRYCNEWIGENYPVPAMASR